MRTIKLLKLIWALFFVRVLHGQRIPRFYGIAWQNPHREYVVAMPIPLNLFAVYLLAAWWWAKSEAWRVTERKSFERQCRGCKNTGQPRA